MVVTYCYAPLSTHDLLSLFKTHTQNGNGSMRDGAFQFLFEISQAPQGAWLMVGDQLREDLQTDIPIERRILFLMEPPCIKEYDLRYLNQFGTIVSPSPIQGFRGRCCLGNPCLGWFAGTGIGSGQGAEPYFHSLQEVLSYPIPEKEKNISIVVSLKKSCQGHRDRIKFLDALRAHFGDRIDYFGRDFAPVDDKLDALAPYKYHIAIENTQIPRYWTEKLTDPLLAWTMPIYCGDPTISDQIPDVLGIEQINISCIDEALGKVETFLKNDPYSSRLTSIKRCREWVLSRSNPYERVCDIIGTAPSQAFAIPPLVKKDIIKMPQEKIMTRVKSALYKKISPIFTKGM